MRCSCIGKLTLDESAGYMRLPSRSGDAPVSVYLKVKSRWEGSSIYLVHTIGRLLSSLPPNGLLFLLLVCVY